MYNQLQLREIFHLEFLRWLGREVNLNNYALKGGVNMRFFFRSFRYSEDIDLDVSNIKVNILRDIVMEILRSDEFQQNLKLYNIERIIPPNIIAAKQTETTQRFKVHLIMFSGEDLFIKIEFSQRRLKGGIVIDGVLQNVLREYRLPPLLVPHYNIHATVLQKIDAIASRSVVQARDIIDLYILSSQYKDVGEIGRKKVEKNKLVKAHENIFSVSFEQFKDTVVSFLASKDQDIFKRESTWDEVKLKTSAFIEELQEKYA